MWDSAFEWLAESKSTAMIAADPDGHIVRWNRGAEQIFGLTRALALGASVERLIPESQLGPHREGVARHHERTAERQAAHHVETVALHADGTPMPIDLSITPCTLDGKPAFAALINVRDAPLPGTADTAAERLQMALDAAALVPWDWDIERGELVWQHSPAPLFGPPPDSGVYPDFREQVHRADLERVLAAGRDALASGGALAVEFRVRSTDGAVRWVEARGRRRQASDGRMHLVGVAHDVTAEHHHTARLAHRADHDPLTGLPNRRSFERRLERVVATARSAGNEHALCYLDLDGFKVVNDTCGHAAGDRCLAQVGRLLAREVRRRDTVARIGGDEFAILMEHCSPLRARSISAALARALEGFTFRCSDHAFPVGVSIGVATIDRATGSAAAALAEADAACYQAKRRGYHRVQLGTGHDRAGGRSGWRSRADWLRTALADRQLRLAAHPIARLHRREDDHAPRWAEVRISGIDEDGQHVEADGFMPAAERHGLAIEVDEWRLAATLDWVAEHGDRAPRCAIAVSLPAVGAEFAQFVCAQLETRGLSPAMLCLEIPERAVDLDPLAASEFAAMLAAAGVATALDGFGHGALLALHRLREFPAQWIKLDSRLLVDAAEDTFAREAVRSIATLATAGGKSSVATGVDDRAMLERATALGIDYAQGAALGAPTPIELRDRPGEPRGAQDD